MWAGVVISFQHTLLFCIALRLLDSTLARMVPVNVQPWLLCMRERIATVVGRTAPILYFPSLVQSFPSFCSPGRAEGALHPLHRPPQKALGQDGCVQHA